MQGFVMFNFIIDYWFQITAFLFAYGAILKLWWSISDIKKERLKCEKTCQERISGLQIEYNNDTKEMREDLKEINKIINSMNLSLTALNSFLQGKGVTP